MKDILDELLKDKRERRAIVLSSIFLFLGIAVVVILNIIFKIEGDGVLITIIALPFLVYMILSGKVSELKGPGGLEAKFREAASGTIDIASERIEPSMDDMQVITKGFVHELERKGKEIDQSKTIIMTMTIGKGDYYNRKAVVEYLKFLDNFRNFKFVVFLDDNKKFIAYIASWGIKGILNNTRLGNEFISKVNDGNIPALFSYPGIVRETITTTSSNTQALQEMSKQNLEALIVINEQNYMVGVVERDQVLIKLLLSIADETKSK